MSKTNDNDKGSFSKKLKVNVRRQRVGTLFLKLAIINRLEALSLPRIGFLARSMFHPVDFV